MSDRHGERHRPDGEDDRPFAVECPSCREHVAVARALVDRAARCPKCRRAFLVPPAVATVPPAATPTAASAVAPAERPAATTVSRDEPLVFAEPPVPSTRRRRDEPPELDVSADAPTAPRAEALPASPSDALATEATSPALDGPTESSADPTLAFREPVKTVRVGGAEIELRQLTPEERRTRRARRNVVILVVGAAILVALVAMLGTRGR